MPSRKIIIDTDPGCDDVLAILLALSALPEELEVLLISVTYGNVDVENCLRNVVSLFYHVEKELAWRKEQDRPLGFESLRKTKPIVAAGPSHPLMEDMLMADFFHGRDGLGDISKTHPHLAPSDTWDDLLRHAAKTSQQDDSIIVDEIKKKDHLFKASHVPAHREILRLLRENEPDTITIVAVGPLTNLAIAASEDPDTFVRAKEVVVMGGVVHKPGNITPVAEFNTFADTVAAARLYALTSPNPVTTTPPIPPSFSSNEGSRAEPPLRPYPAKLSRRLRVTLFPLDITDNHVLTRGVFRQDVAPLVKAGSPLAEWVTAWMDATFAKVESLRNDISGDAVNLGLHDPMTIWYCMSDGDPKWLLKHNEDLRVETSGQWTRGMCVTDGRSRRKLDDDEVGDQPGDHGDWLRGGAGNRLSRCVQSPGEEIFGPYLLKRIFHT